MSDFISKKSSPLHLQSNVMHIHTTAILLVPNANCVPKKGQQPLKVGGSPALCDDKGWSPWILSSTSEHSADHCFIDPKSTFTLCG